MDEPWLEDEGDHPVGNLLAVELPPAPVLTPALLLVTERSEMKEIIIK